MYAAPIIFYSPSDSTLKGYDKRLLAQQIDILPTVMNYLGYDKPFVAFGKDLFDTTDNEAFVFNYLTGIYQYAKGDYFMRFDGNEVRAVFNFREDPELRNNLLEKIPQDTVEAMENELKAFIQQYASRMKNNELVVKE